MEIFDGADTECSVTILVENCPEMIGFKKSFVSVKRSDKFFVLELLREGRIDSDNEIRCLVSTLCDNDIL